MGKRKYDFAGWVTKNDIRCSDGVTIKHDAFRDNDGERVPLVWNHNYDTPNNVLGSVLLQNERGGVYGFGFFNDTKEAQSAKELVKHGDISSMSIGARKLKRAGENVVHGSIYEVSLVLAGANPGARIDTVMQHSDDGAETNIIHTGNLIHSADDILQHSNDDEFEQDDKTIGDVIYEMDDEQKEAVATLLEMVMNPDEEDEEVDMDDVKHSIDLMTDEQREAVFGLVGLVAEDTITHADTDELTIGDVIDTMNVQQKDAVYALLGIVANQNNDEQGDDDEMKQNVFSRTKGGQEELVLKHSLNEVLKFASEGKVSSLKDFMAAQEDDTLTHGINSIEMLFPEAAHPTNGNVPILYKDPNTAFARILDSVTKSPFSKVRTLIADLTEDEARAKGYIKGNMKKEEYFSLIKRQTGPTTIYKKQKLDRDDVIDITDFDVVAFMNVEMQMMLKEEIARAILVGDGRDFSHEDKINEQNIRPIIGDHDFFTIQKSFADAADFIEQTIKARAEYRGSGQPDMYIDPTLLADVKLLKGTDGKFLFGDIPSTAAVAARLDVNEIVPTTFMTGKGALIVNLRDYTLGATKGGQITNFDDFDIDFNQYKYLIETRLSGSLTLPKSAIQLTKGTAKTGANAADAGLTYGKRQADKTEPEA